MRKRVELLVLPAAVLLILAFSGSLIPTPPSGVATAQGCHDDAALDAGPDEAGRGPQAEDEAFALQARLEAAP